MSGPEQTSTDPWSQWDTNFKSPTDWPGLGYEHSSGYEIDRDGVKASAGNLIQLAASAFDRRHSSVCYFGEEHSLHSWHRITPGFWWQLPQELAKLLGKAHELFYCFWLDLHAETVMAGLLIEHSAQRYDLVEEPLLGDLALSDFTERVGGILSHDASKRLSSRSSLYPNGGALLTLPQEPLSEDYGVHYMTLKKANEDLFPKFDQEFLESTAGIGSFACPLPYKEFADSLAELVQALQSRARDLRESPWRGAAADNAQEALRQICGNATALAAIAGDLATANSRYSEVSNECRLNFQRVVDPDRSGWNEVWDFGATPDSRTRDFLAGSNQDFWDIYSNMPDQIREDLPGLFINDKSLADIRQEIHEVQTHRDKYLNSGELLDSYQEDLRTAKEAERKFG
ncbi:WXG100 family type VII secretion target [Streptosporangium sp. NBC_01639]|uniref:hypothetical protein n=1 Tax=Streptosporangium sp. NBC_01639 TaxID=2975948 RepID=UPI00386F8700|nr:WXG100 family type VII secretion target [Streptosporangium sp. NBC_01639]